MRKSTDKGVGGLFDFPCEYRIRILLTWYLEILLAMCIFLKLRELREFYDSRIGKYEVFDHI